MKSYFIIFLLSFFWLFLNWCLDHNIKELEDNLETSSVLLNCSENNYYSTVQIHSINKLTWNQWENAYSLVIPELCTEIISRPNDSKTDINKWHEEVENRFNSFLWIKIDNNKIIINDSIFFIIEDKIPDITLQESINEKYYLWISDEEDLQFNWESYCKITNKKIYENTIYTTLLLGKNDSDVQYIVQTPYNIARNNNLWEASLYRQLCWTLFPFQDVWFWINIPFNILYTDKHPSRYILYSLDWWNEKQSPIMNITFKYLD